MLHPPLFWKIKKTFRQRLTIQTTIQKSCYRYSALIARFQGIEVLTMRLITTPFWRNKQLYFYYTSQENNVNHFLKFPRLIISPPFLQNRRIIWPQPFHMFLDFPCIVGINHRAGKLLNPHVCFFHGTRGDKCKKSLFLVIHITADLHPLFKFFVRALPDSLSRSVSGAER